MFDSAPPNLPVEPSAPLGSPAPFTPPLSAPSVPETPQPIITTPRKEPEDMFSGLEREVVRPLTSTPSPESSSGGVPWKKLLVLFGAMLLLVVVVAVVWAYVVAPKRKSKALVTQTVAEKTQLTEAPKPVAAQLETPTVVETSPTVVTQPPPGVTIPTPVLPPPATLALTEGRDTDGDGLTDVEEPYYDVDSTKSDTNGNGYPDGLEVRNLYDPSKNGRRLPDAPFVSKLTWTEWSFLVPKPWSVVSDAKDEKKASLTTGTAARFHLELLSNPEKYTIDTWLLKQQLTASQPFKTKGGIDARQTADGLTTYLSSGDSVLRVTYDLNGDTTFDLRASYIMFLHSLTFQRS